MNLPPHKYQDPERKDWMIGIALLVFYVLMIGISAFWLLPDFWYLWLILVLGGMLLLVLRQTKDYACRCRECGQEFEISFLANLLAPHGVDRQGSWEWVRCPICEKRTRCTVIRIIKAGHHE